MVISYKCSNLCLSAYTFLFNWYKRGSGGCGNSANVFVMLRAKYSISLRKYLRDDDNIIKYIRFKSCDLLISSASELKKKCRKTLNFV